MIITSPLESKFPVKPEISIIKTSAEIGAWVVPDKNAIIEMQTIVA